VNALLPDRAQPGQVPQQFCNGGRRERAQRWKPM